MQPWKTLSRRMILDRGKFLRVEEHVIELPDGRIIDDWTWVITPDYINVVAATAEGRFLCFRQTKYSVEGTTLAVEPERPIRLGIEAVEAELARQPLAYAGDRRGAGSLRRAGDEPVDPPEEPPRVRHVDHDARVARGEIENGRRSVVGAATATGEAERKQDQADHEQPGRSVHWSNAGAVPTLCRPVPSTSFQTVRADFPHTA